MNRHAVCTRAVGSCEECGRPKCDRCGRCKSRVPKGAPGNWRLFCPSNWCRVKAVLRGLIPV